MRRSLAVIIIFLMAAGLVAQLPHVSARTINVPGDYTTIQAAINAANSGDTIQVSSGRYYEDVEINKPVSLIGDSTDIPTIYCMQDTYDANVNIGLPFDVNADNVAIANFNIQNPNPFYGAIKANGVSNLQIRNVVFSQNRFGGIAIDLQGCTNFQITQIQNNGCGRVEIKDCTNGGASKNSFSNVEYPFIVRGSTNIRLEENSILQSSEGIQLYDSPNCILNENKIDSFYGNIHAISLTRSPGCTLNGNTITNATGGLFLSESGSCTLRNNAITKSNAFIGSEFGVEGYKPEDFTQNIDSSNTVEGKTIYYLQNLHDTTINPTYYPNAGYLAVVASQRVTIEGFNLRNCLQGILLAQTTGSTIKNNTIIHCSDGVSLQCYSNNNLIYGNVFRSNEVSFRAYYSSDNQLINNDMTGSGTLWIDTSSNYQIIGNSLCGTKLVNAENITSYSNNFIASNYNLGAHYTSETGYPTGGNYHIDYNGVDQKSGISQGQPGPDGIGDTAYWSGDYYPLMEPVRMFEATVGGKAAYISMESNSTITGFQIDTASHTVSFNAYGNAGSNGFARIEIPQAISRSEWGNDYTINVNGKVYTYTATAGAEADYAYVSYPNAAETIFSMDSSGGLPIWLIAVLAVIAILVAVAAIILEKTRMKNH